MHRRAFIRTTGAILGTSALVSSTTGARREGYLPNGKVSHSIVTPFPNDDRTVPAGDWLVHRVGWVDEGETAREDIDHFLQAVDLDAWIDGERVGDEARFWREPYVVSEGENAGQWAIWWKYATPPKGVGEHSFRVVFTFEEDHEGLPAGSEFPLDGGYVVEPRQGGP